MKNCGEEEEKKEKKETLRKQKGLPMKSEDLNYNHIIIMLK